MRQARERLAAEGRGVSVTQLVDPGDIASVLPAVVALHRARDHAASRRSDLDDEARRTFYESVVRQHSARREVELWLVRVDGELAAYDLAFVDGSAYRLWDGRIAPALSRFAPGHLGREAVLERVVSDPALDELDWMRGEQPYKHQMARAVDATHELRAWSSPAAAAALDMPRRGRAWFRQMRTEYPVLQRAWMAVKERTVLERARRR